MASTGPYHDQPGLEVIHPETGLQVSYPPQEWSYTVLAEEGHKEVVYRAEVPKSDRIVVEHDPTPRKRITKKVLLIALASVIIVVGVIVGATVGTQKPRTAPSGQADPGEDSHPSPTSPAEMTGNPTSVWPGLAPTAVSWGYPHLEIFALTRNNTEAVYRKYRNTNATDENDFVPAGNTMELVGGNINTNSVPSIAVNQRISYYASNQTEMFINTQGNCWGKQHENDQLWTPPGYDSWSACFAGLSVTGAPTFVHYDPEVEAAQAFYLAATGEAGSGLAAYSSKWQPQTEWSAPARIPGPGLQPMRPAAAAWYGNDSRVDLFAVAGADSHLLHASWDATVGRDVWSAYEDLQGFATAPPAAVSRGPGLLDVFVRGGDAGLWHLARGGDGAWGAWARISGAGTRIQGQPDAVSASPGAVDVFAWREDGSLLHKSFDGGAGRWTPEEDFDVLVDGAADGKLSGPPKAVSDGPGSIHVFAYREQKELIWKHLNSGQAATGNTTSLANVPYLT
ncbi:hypothetical protein Hte_010992 [Hypoxylon texense]